ncbi:AAA family ATPase [Peterkaempfera bronchialis]|uniref:AAA family ATPase n=1 Tax=Peterkaempfera bronchialis TaxID=2126346 RepID=UPI003C2EF444
MRRGRRPRQQPPAAASDNHVGGSTVLLERESAHNLVAAALLAAQAGRGSMLLVRGPLGIGKSALLESVNELGSRLDALTLRANAASMEHDFSFGVVRQLLEPALSRASPADVERWLSGAAQNSRPALADDTLTSRPYPHRAPEFEAVLHGLSTLVATMSRDRLLLILIDDLHWADAESLHWLRHFARRMQSKRVLLVCTLLDGDIRAELPSVRELTGHAQHTIVPTSLGIAGTRTLVHHHCDGPADEEFVTACHRASGGNPLFLTSLLTEAAFRGLKPSAEHAADAAGLRPSLLRQRLLVLLTSLPEQVRRTAFAMTILDPDPDAELLGRLAGLDAVRQAEALRILHALGLVTGLARPRFVHPVVQDAVEEGMPLSERAAMHVVAAELLHRSGRPAEQVADQLMAVITPQGPWAAQVLRTAADSALRRGAPKAAAQYLRRALLDSSPAGPDRARLLVDLATVERSFATSASVRHVAQAVPLLDSTREQAAALARLGPIVIDSVSLQVDEMLRRIAGDLTGSGQLEGPDRELALRLEARLRYMSAWDPADLATSVRRLSGLGPDPAIDTVGERELLAVLIYAATAANSIPASEAARLSMQLLDREPPSPVHVHTTLPLTTAVLAGADHVDGVMAWLDEAYRIAERREGDVEQAVIRTEQSLVALASGDLADARAKILEAYQLSGSDQGGFTTMSASTLAVVALQADEPGLAEQILRRHRVGVEAQHLAALLAMVKGATAARQRDRQAALDHFLNAGHRLEQISWHNPVLLPWASRAALMHHRLGDTVRAAELSRHEVEQAQAWGAPATVGRALSVQGLVTPGRRGLELLEESVEILESSANRFELCKALTALGERLGAPHSRGAAALRRALDLAVECGAPSLSERIRIRLGNGSPEPRMSPLPLTPAEHKVARLAATGSSNQAIADQLSISVRAVEKHLTSCYRKLGIKGRSALAPALDQRGAGR